MAAGHIMHTTLPCTDTTEYCSMSSGAPLLLLQQVACQAPSGLCRHMLINTGSVVCCSNVTIQVTQGDKPVKVLCPGGQYEVKVCVQEVVCPFQAVRHAL